MHGHARPVEVPVRTSAVAPATATPRGVSTISISDSPTFIGTAHQLTEGLLEPRLDVTRIELPVPDLPGALHGFRIAQVSDLHLGVGRWRPIHVQDAIDVLRAEDPDVVVNTGDYLQGDPSLKHLLPLAACFVLPSRPGQSGRRNIAILGNHDYFPGVDVASRLADGLRTLDVTVLQNNTVCITHCGEGISFVGLSGEEGYAEFDRGLRALAASDHPRVALIHNPDMAELLPVGSAELVLCGHTHGGQIVLPGLRRWTVRRFCGSHFTHGLYEINGMPVYVNRGLGCSGLPFRFRAAPELTLITLVR